MKRKTFLLSILGGAATAPFTAGCKRQPSASDTAPNPSRAEQLAERVVEHTNALYFVGAAYIGDRLGLFKAMAGAGPLTAKQLAGKTGINERYVLEWLRTMASARYLGYHPDSNSFEMPREHAAVLVDEDSPTFSAGLIEATVPDIFMIARLMAAFRSGKGISYGDYPPEVFDATERITKPDYRHLLTQRWLPAVPGAVDRLRAGGSAADLGCGAGLASIAIAKAFPQARAFGFDPYAPSVARARENAQAASVADRVKFDTFDGVLVPGGPYDLITINYSLHHAGNPVGLLRATRQALASDGSFLIVEYRKSARLEEDINTPRGGIYGSGLLECIPTALAVGGPGYGTGITEPDVRELAAKAGYREFTRVIPEDPLRSFFVLRA
jgi:SAM-dependent methyltransferase